MAGTYELKDIQIVITLDEGGANNQYVFQGFATKAAIAKQGGVDFATAQVEIYGLSLEKMGQLTMLAFKALNRRSNLIEILAGEKGTQLMSVFKGQVFVAYADLNGSSPVLKIEAKTAAYPILKPTPQIAVSGTQSVEQLAQSFADEAGMTLKNEGVAGVVSDCVFTGDPITKLRQLSDMIGVDMIPDDGQIVLLPHGETRAPEGSIPVINAESGMIGYPTFTNTGIQGATFFRPDLRIGASVRVESIVPHATGTWKIVQLSHELSANMPSSSSWLTTFAAMWLGE